MRARLHPLTIVLVVGALAGVLFAAVSTYDFAMHLDRQVHDVHCSFVPGLSGPERGESGCQVTLISPYSSVFRSKVWGGVPIALPAMAVFAFLAFFAIELILSQRQSDRRATGFAALATGLPLVTSAIMAYISLVRLDAVCKLCMGIYIASVLCAIGGIGLWLRARKLGDGALDDTVVAPPAAEEHPAEPAWVSGKEAAPAARPAAAPVRGGGPGFARSRAGERSGGRAPAGVSMGYVAAAFGVGVVFVATPVLAYMAAAPDHSGFVGQCGGLPKPSDEYGVMISLDPHPGKPPAIEILDPLCPACRGFEQRLAASALDAEMDRKAVLFPLDDTCNWMVDSAVHAGACAVSEAMLCAGDRARVVLDWAFANQKQIRDAATADKGAAAAMVSRQFPDLAGCIGSADVRAKLNRSLRWAVANQLPVLTPQLYVGGAKLCDEDVDLGLEFSLERLLAAYRAGTLPPVAETQPAAAEPPAERAPPPPTAPATPAPAPASTETKAETPPAETAPPPAPSDSPATSPAARPEPAEPAEPPAETEKPAPTEREKPAPAPAPTEPAAGEAETKEEETP